MINGRRIAVVLPAYNAEKTLEATVRELPDLVDIRILVDDHSSDRTVEVAKQLGLKFYVHDANYGYGRNQQTCYREAIAAGADVVIMVHPDYQYTPLLVTAMASMVAYDVYDVVLGSRILGGQALRGGMPIWKYVSNRFLTAFENFFLGVKLSEYHSGYRAFSRDVLTRLPLLENSDDFVFDTKCWHNVSTSVSGSEKCRVRRIFNDVASSINFRRSVKYGMGVLSTTLQFALQDSGSATSGSSVLTARGWNRGTPNITPRAGPWNVEHARNQCGNENCHGSERLTQPTCRTYPTNLALMTKFVSDRG